VARRTDFMVIGILLLAFVCTIHEAFQRFSNPAAFNS